MQSNKYKFRSCDYVKLCIYTDAYFLHLPQPPHIPSLTMRSLSTTQINHILSLLDKGTSATKVSSILGVGLSTISRLRSKHRSSLSKSIGGCPHKLSPPDIHYAIHLITSQKADNAVQVTKTLQNMLEKPLSAYTVQRALKKAGMEAVVKVK